MSEEMENATENQKSFDESYVKELRSEAANYRVQLREAQEKIEGFEKQKESQQKESLTKELLFAAKEAGAVDPETVSKLVDIDSLDVQDGDYTSAIQASVNNLLTEKPFLKGGNLGKPSNPAGGNGQPTIFTKEVLDTMSADEINANWADIQEQMAKGLIR